jgi:hypothetical protein
MKILAGEKSTLLFHVIVTVAGLKQITIFVVLPLV